MALPHCSPHTSFQTPMWSWQCWTPRGKRCPSARRPCAAASPTPPTRRRSYSRWHSSSCPRCRWCWRCSAAGAAWGPGRGWAGSPWASTAPARSSRPTGQRWRRRRVSRSATGTHSPTHRRKLCEDWARNQSVTCVCVLHTGVRTGKGPQSSLPQTAWLPFNLPLFSEADRLNWRGWRWTLQLFYWHKEATADWEVMTL